jgi:hypothetical protein
LTANVGTESATKFGDARDIDGNPSRSTYEAVVN